MQVNNPTLLLFDIDGTLLKTDGAGMRAMASVGAKIFGAKFVWHGVEMAGHLDPHIYANAARKNQIADHDQHHERFRALYLEELDREIQRTKARLQVMPGIHDTLDLLRCRAAEKGDVVLGLLTGNYTGAVPIKLLAANIDPDWFTITAFGDEAETRPDLVRLAMQRYEKLTGRPADPRQVVVIGDTPLDVACARAHGCVALAVATGDYSAEILQAAGADVVCADLVDPTPLVQLIR